MRERREDPQTKRKYKRTLPFARRKGRAWSIGLELLGVLLAVSVACVSLLYAAKGAHRASRTHLFPPKPSSAEALRPVLPSSTGIPPHFERILNGKYIEDAESYRFVYTVDPTLQASVNEILRSGQTLLGTFLALERPTGKILSL